MTRNAVFDALLAIGAAVEPAGTGTTWGESGRKLKSVDKAIMPALFQVEPDENFESRLGQMSKRKLSAIWIIMHNFGKDQSVVPAEKTADMLDQIDAALGAPVHRQSLGGGAYAAFIDGQIRKWEGDLDGITILTVPISILLP